MTAPDRDAAALFELPAAPPGPVRVAMVEQIAQWIAAGRALSPAIKAALLAQADAIDLAARSGKATQVSGANRVLTDMLVAFHLVGDVPPAGGDKFDQFLAAVTAVDQAAPDG